MRDIRVAPIDDAMLLSYTLDAGATGDDHSVDTLSERFLGHKPIPLSEVAGSGRNSRRARARADRKGLRIRSGESGHRPASAARVAAAHRGRADDDGLRAARASARRGSGAHGAARDRDRPQHPVAHDGRVFPAHGRARGRDQQDRRRALQPRLAETAWRHSVRPDGPARRQEDRDRRLVDHRERARGPRRRRPSIAGARARMAADLEAQVDLHRRAAGLRQSLDRPRPHGLRARLDDNRAPVVVGAQPAEHSDPHRGRAQDPARLCRARRTQAHLGRLQPDRAAGFSPISPTFRRSSAPSPTNSTFTP